jgi:hypothetical protein
VSEPTNIAQIVANELPEDLAAELIERSIRGRLLRNPALATKQRQEDKEKLKKRSRELAAKILLEEVRDGH